jgi:hypothetical protein
MMSCTLYATEPERNKELRLWWAIFGEWSDTEVSKALSDIQVDALARLNWKLFTTKCPNIVHDATLDDDKGRRARKKLALGLELHPLPFHTEEKALDFVQEFARRVVANHGLGDVNSEELAALITEIDNLLTL